MDTRERETNVKNVVKTKNARMSLEPYRIRFISLMITENEIIEAYAATSTNDNALSQSLFYIIMRVYVRACVLLTTFR